MKFFLLRGYVHRLWSVALSLITQRAASDHRLNSVPLLHGGFKLVILAAVVFNLAPAGAGNWIALFVKLHAKIQARTAQNVANLTQRFFAEVLRGQHLSFRPLHQITNGLDTGVLQTLIRAHG